jgi:Soluble lytic murein transglycosylase and related regulatory proteins (some contain LysM/invasin domains)
MKFKSVFLLLLAIAVGLLAARSYVYKVLYPLKYESYITSYSKANNVDPYLIMAMIKTESRYDRNAVSEQGAIGLMQLTESTAGWIAEKIGVTEYQTDKLYDPEINIKMGTWYYNNLKEEFGTSELALAAYNAGRGNVKEWLSSDKISKDGLILDHIVTN